MQTPARTQASSRPASPLAEALRSLRRAIGTLRSYPSGNELTERALADLEQRLGRVLPVCLTLAPEEVLAADGLPIEIDDGFRSLVRELYRDGVRELRIEVGMARPELDRWVATLAVRRDSQDLSEDYVTLLWEAELSHVAVRALDPYLEREIPGDVLEGKARPSGEIEGIEGPVLPHTPAPPEEAFRLEEGDLEKLELERRRAAAESPWPSFVRALREVLHSAVAARRADELRGVVEATLFRLVAESQLRLAVELAREARMRADCAASGWTAVLERACRADRLARLTLTLERDPSQQPLVSELLLALGDASAAAAEQFLCAATSPGSRRAWAETLAAFGAPGQARLASLLAQGEPAVVACTAQVLAAAGDRRHLEAIWRAFEASVSPARRELLRAAAALAGERERGRLLAVAVADPDEDCRLLALGELARLPAAGLGEALVARARSRGFEDLAEREKDALFRALAQAGGAEVVAFLASFLSGGWWLARASHGDRMRAVRALVREGSERALAVLREGAVGRTAVADLCRLALRGVT